MEVREFVNGGPLDGDEIACHGDFVRVASRRGVLETLHQGASPDLVRRVAHHVYQVGIEDCAEGCCSRPVMIYMGVSAPDVPRETDSHDS